MAGQQPCIEALAGVSKAAFPSWGCALWKLPKYSVNSREPGSEVKCENASAETLDWKLPLLSQLRQFLFWNPVVNPAGDRIQASEQILPLALLIVS